MKDVNITELIAIRIQSGEDCPRNSNKHDRYRKKIGFKEEVSKYVNVN